MALAVVELAVVALAVVELAVVELAVVELAVVELAVVELAVVELAVVELAVVELAVVELAVVELAVVELAVVELAVVELAVVEEQCHCQCQSPQTAQQEVVYSYWYHYPSVVRTCRRRDPARFASALVPTLMLVAPPPSSSSPVLLPETSAVAANVGHPEPVQVPDPYTDALALAPEKEAEPGPGGRNR